MQAVTSIAAPAPPPARRSVRWVLLPLTVAALVAVAVGLVARWQSTSSGRAEGGYFDLFFSDPIHLKAWFATAAGVLACFQLFTAAWMYRKLPLTRNPIVNVVHRWSGRAAFVCTLPVAYHCLFKLGFQGDDDRVLVHSLLGCVFYGAYAAKVLIVKMKRYPVWVIPTAGGFLFTSLVTVWYTSAFWFFSLVGEGL
jgi:Family of unknown function (DUF6529)